MTIDNERVSGSFFVLVISNFMDLFELFKSFFKKEIKTHEMALLSEEGRKDVLRRIKIKGIEKAVRKPFKIISTVESMNSVVVEFEGISQRIFVSKSDIVE
jgi:hypothetical protein